MNEIDQSLRSFREKLRILKLPDSTRLYAAKVDIKSCFDSIDHRKLLKESISFSSPHGYRIFRWVSVKVASPTKFKRVFHKQAVPYSSVNNCCAWLDFASSLKSSVIVQKLNYGFSHLKTSKLNSVLNRHVRQHLVHIPGDSCYKQVIGIPQGSVLSSLLCRFL